MERLLLTPRVPRPADAGGRRADTIRVVAAMARSNGSCSRSPRRSSTTTRTWRGALHVLMVERDRRQARHRRLVGGRLSPDHARQAVLPGAWGLAANCRGPRANGSAVPFRAGRRCDRSDSCSRLGCSPARARSRPTSLPSTPTPVPSESPFRRRDGARLPDGTRRSRPDAAGGPARRTPSRSSPTVAWATHPLRGDLACLFPPCRPGPFAWGPQGDRVLLSDFRVRGWRGARSPARRRVDRPLRLGSSDRARDRVRGRSRHPAEAVPPGGQPDPADVAATGELPRGGVSPQRTGPRVRGRDAGRPGDLVVHERGRGSATARVLRDRDRVHLARLLGQRQDAVVDGAARRGLPGAALHAAREPELRNGVAGHRGNGGGRPPAPAVRRLRSGHGGCRVRASSRLDPVGGSTVRALPEEPRPSEALGWLDADTLLVGVGGCGDPVDLWAVDASGENDAAALVLGVEIAAPRTQVVNPPKEVPAPPAEEPRHRGSGDSALGAAGRPPSGTDLTARALGRTPTAAEERGSPCPRIWAYGSRTAPAGWPTSVRRWATRGSTSRASAGSGSATAA